MPVLANPKHEQFVQHLLSGLSATRAYINVYGDSRGAGQSAGRLLKNAEVCARLSELQNEVAVAVVQTQITQRNERVQVLQDFLDRGRRLIEARALQMREIPGGETGLLVEDWKGKDATTPVYRADTPLLSAMLATMRQAAEELGQRIVKTEETSSIDIIERLKNGRRRVAEMRARMAQKVTTGS